MFMAVVVLAVLEVSISTWIDNVYGGIVYPILGYHHIPESVAVFIFGRWLRKHFPSWASPVILGIMAVFGVYPFIYAFAFQVEITLHISYHLFLLLLTILVSFGWMSYKRVIKAQ